MPIMVINAPDDVAVESVRHLPRIEVLAVVNAPAALPLVPERTSVARLIGSLSDESAERMRRETVQLRTEWERAS